ncbi:MAG: NB-ARC domain-containing protein, partial [Calditrichaceae bacterium]
MLKNIRDIDGISYKYYKDHKELEKLIAADLSLLLTEAYESFHQKDSGNPAGEKIHNIPAPATSILGREKEIETARKYLQSGEKRLLTFTGPGGSGKTRLSIEVGHKLSSDFPFIHFIELAAIHDPDLTPDAIAHGMGLREAGEKRADRIIKEYVANKSMLLILDNFEQIADDASVLIAELLSSCPELKVLITSRMALRIRGEQEMPILPLDTPDLSNTIDYYTLSDYAAVALFCQRAGDINPDFTIDEENLKSIAEICRSLDGLPLAIELAAARIRLLSPKSMLEKLTPRLHLLTNGAKDLPERQQTMYQTIAWSYNLLDQDEAALFRQLAAFPGGARIDIIESVCYDNKCGFDILSGMEGLVRKSLVYAKETSQGEICFNMLETIREFALDQLKKKNEQSEIFNQHAHYFADLTEHAEPYLISGERNSWLIKLEDEI